MSYEIIPSTFVHRDTKVIQRVICRYALTYQGISVYMAQIERDGKWYLIPASYFDDDLMADVGPYDTAEELLFMAKLYCEAA